VARVTDSSTRTPRPFVAFALTVFCAGLIAFALSWRLFPPNIDLRLVLVMAGAALSEFFAFSFPIYSMSLAFPLAMSAAMLGGPASACLVAAVSSVSLQDLRDRKPALVLLFNVGQLLLTTAVGGFAYVTFGGRILSLGGGEYLPLGAADFPAALTGMVAAAALSYGTNFVLTSTGVALYRRAPFRVAFASGVGLIPTQTALAFIGFLMAQVLAIAAITLPLFVFPLAIGREFYQRYVGLRDAYRDTIKSLVGALETKDSYTRGHSVRVAVFAAQIGGQMGLDERQLENLEYAALLHDLGKLSLPSHILTKPSQLTDEEMDAMRNHPAAGAQMVERIPPLRGLTPHVAAHHEWYGGGGYPSGVAGEKIPSFARILSVADAYDAMTTDRAYRPAMSEADALDEVLRGSGTQFDPDVVGAFLASRLTHGESGIAERGPALIPDGGVSTSEAVSQ